MRPAPGSCDRCGKPVGGVGTFAWIEREMGAVSFAWADCGCGHGTVGAAICRRAALTSPQLERAARAAIVRHRKEKRRRAEVRRSPAYLAAVASCSCPDCADRRREMTANTDRSLASA
jgi:hypothetical protein